MYLVSDFLRSKTHMHNPKSLYMDHNLSFVNLECLLQLLNKVGLYKNEEAHYAVTLNLKIKILQNDHSSLQKSILHEIFDKIMQFTRRANLFLLTGKLRYANSYICSYWMLKRVVLKRKQNYNDGIHIPCNFQRKIIKERLAPIKLCLCLVWQFLFTFLDTPNQ